LIIAVWWYQRGLPSKILLSRRAPLCCAPLAPASASAAHTRGCSTCGSALTPRGSQDAPAPGAAGGAPNAEQGLQRWPAAHKALFEAAVQRYRAAYRGARARKLSAKAARYLAALAEKERRPGGCRLRVTTAGALSSGATLLAKLTAVRRLAVAGDAVDVAPAARHSSKLPSLLRASTLPPQRSVGTPSRRA
jgi:hypothetical protein